MYYWKIHKNIYYDDIQHDKAKSDAEAEMDVMKLKDRPGMKNYADMLMETEAERYYVAMESIKE